MVLSAPHTPLLWTDVPDQDPGRGEIRIAITACGVYVVDGALVPLALKAVRKGGRVVCAGIHMSDIPSFPYADLGKSGKSSRWRTSRGRMAWSSWHGSRGWAW